MGFWGPRPFIRGPNADKCTNVTKLKIFLKILIELKHKIGNWWAYTEWWMGPKLKLGWVFYFAS